MKRDKIFYLSRLPEKGNYEEIVYRGSVDNDMNVEITLLQDDVDLKIGYYKKVIYSFYQMDAYFNLGRCLDETCKSLSQGPQNTGMEFVKTGIPFQSLKDKAYIWLKQNETF